MKGLPAFRSVWLRLTKYASNHGARETIVRALTEANRLFRENRALLYWYELGSPTARVQGAQARVERFSQNRLPSTRVVQEMEKYQQRDLLRENLKRRLGAGAVLWLLSVDDVVIGYVWSINGRTMKSFYWPLTSKDVHLFDNFVFPQHRGKRYNSILLGNVLAELHRVGMQRAYIATAEWNTAEQRSLSRVGFTALGVVKTGGTRRRKTVRWWNLEEVLPEHADH